MSLDPQQLLDEIALREASLLDARRERAAGELSSHQLTAIEQRERGAIERARAELEARDVPSPSPRATPRPRVRRARWLVVAITSFALALGVVLWASITPRQAGNSITGSITLGRAQAVQQLLGEAEADVANGDVVAALNAYQQVLAHDNTNVVALTQTGWLDFSAGSADHSLTLITLGERDLRRAIALAPRQPASRLYYAIVADSTSGNGALARAEFETFLRLGPTPGQLAVARPFLVRLGLAPS